MRGVRYQILDLILRFSHAESELRAVDYLTSRIKSMTYKLKEVLEEDIGAVKGCFRKSDV